MNLLNKYQELYNQLDHIKDTKDFKKFGFGKGGPYNDFLLEVQQYRNEHDKELVLKDSFLFGDIEQLCYAYVSNRTELIEELINQITIFFE